MVKPTQPFDPFAIARVGAETAMGLAARPGDLLKVQRNAVRQWGEYWSTVLTPGEKPRDRRFASPEWQDHPYFRSIRDAYLLASEQLRDIFGQAAAGDQVQLLHQLHTQFAANALVRPGGIGPTI